MADTQLAQGSNGDVAGNPPADGAAQEQARPGVWATVKSLIFRMLIIYMISSFFRRGTPPANQSDGSGGKSINSQNIYPKGMKMDMYIYLSEQEDFTDFNNEDALFWSLKGLEYGDWTSGPNGDGSYIKEGKIQTPPNVINNGSIYLHCYFVKEGKSPNPKDKGKYSKKLTVHRSKRINKYKKRRFHKTVNLLTGETDVHPDLIQTENRSAFEILNHWHPNLTINLMDDHSPWMKNHVPQPLDEYIEFLPGTDNYQPILYFNDYWNLNTDYMPINQTTPVLNLTITYSPISLFKWQMYAAQGMRNKWYGMLGADFVEESDEDQDSLKTTVLETNPYLLALTVIISIVHSVFEFLAFKNDIQFWKNRKSLEGLSVRSVFFNVFQSLIVVLYVLDNETNFMVKVSVSIGLLIEMWKITKVVTFKIDRENLWFGVIPRVTYEDKSTYTESMTKKYDMMAFKYLSWMLFPLLIGYAIYSLLYLEHKGWYSWVLNMVYGFLLTFGFIMMTPQLFINYKMKSVAHLPWRMMTYKALNTFIDDIFAFVIKMPTLYRIGCFRDDVVFFIFLYQRWIYPIDPTRLNEFGTSQEMLEQNGKVTADQSETGSEQASIEQSKPEETELPSEKPAKEKKND
ncbi:putative lipid scramblase CLPTM1 [Crassostrea angulata]|uniref:putative lipid scramblase CLPTM1 n=1 Tax=Magallana angulata TaxID=2784310 RepID=UPI0022B13802|nr:putative lipid scramblase CLPTM1 [Crassostrea angulata]